MGLFYAYVNSINSDWGDTCIIIFASRIVADEWWRTLQDKVSAGKMRFSGIERVTPQFYFYRPIQETHIASTTSHQDGAPEFWRKVIFSYQKSQMDIIPVQDIVDHVSGNYYFIRSRYDTSLYWHYSDDDGFIKASRTERTRFRVSIRPRGGGSARSPNSTVENYDGKIMIGSDNVQISLGSDDTKFVCVVGPDLEEDLGGGLKREFKEPQVAEMSPAAAITTVVTVSERFRSIKSTTEKLSGGSDVGTGIAFSTQGILRLGKTPENFRFKEFLDGLFDEWELAN